MSKRIIIAVTVDDDVNGDNLATGMPADVGQDATVWEWAAFWADVDDGVITPRADTTRKCLLCNADIGEYSIDVALCAVCDPDVDDDSDPLLR